MKRATKYPSFCFAPALTADVRQTLFLFLLIAFFLSCSRSMSFFLSCSHSISFFLSCSYSISFFLSCSCYQRSSYFVLALAAGVLMILILFCCSPHFVLLVSVLILFLILVLAFYQSCSCSCRLRSNLLLLSRYIRINQEGKELEKYHRAENI